MSRPARSLGLFPFQSSPSLSLLHRSTLSQRLCPRRTAPYKFTLSTQPRTPRFGQSRVQSLLYSTGPFRPQGSPAFFADRVYSRCTQSWSCARSADNQLPNHQFRFVHHRWIFRSFLRPSNSHTLDHGIHAYRRRDTVTLRPSG
jgi:hypothetical protein